MTEPTVATPSSHATAPPSPRAAASPSEPLTSIPPEVWRIATVIVLGAFMANLDTSLVNVGLDTIGRRFHARLDSAQWITSGYLLALAGALPLCGWLGRRIGAGRLWLWALVGFTLASGLCAAAPNLPVLVVLRVVQGVTGGLLIPAGQTILGQAAGPRRMGRVMNTVGIAVVLAPAIGPTVGGLLIAHLSWRWLFLINIPIGVIALLLGLRIVPRGQRGSAAPFDATGFILVSAGLPLLTYAIITASTRRSITTPAVLATGITGIIALVAFVWSSLHRQAPLLDLRLFKNRVYTAAETTVLFSGAALFGGMIILPLYFELLRNKGVVATGLLLMIYGVGAALAMRFGGRLTDRLGGGIVSVYGLLLTVVTTIPLAYLGRHVNLVGVEALQFVRGIGLGLAALPALSAAYATVTRDQLPDATAQSNILQRVGGSIGSALFVVVLEDKGPPSTAAFHDTFWWLSMTSAAALLCATWLTVEQRRTRKGDDRAEMTARDPA